MRNSSSPGETTLPVQPTPSSAIRPETRLARAASALVGRVRALPRELWRLRWVILANVYLAAPVFVHDLALGFWQRGDVDELALFAVPASLFWLMAVQIWAQRLWLVHLTLLPFYVLVG